MMMKEGSAVQYTLNVITIKFFSSFFHPFLLLPSSLCSSSAAKKRGNEAWLSFKARFFLCLYLWGMKEYVLRLLKTWKRKVMRQIVFCFIHFCCLFSTFFCILCAEKYFQFAKERNLLFQNVNMKNSSGRIPRLKSTTRMFWGQFIGLGDRESGRSQEFRKIYLSLKRIIEEIENKKQEIGLLPCFSELLTKRPEGNGQKVKEDFCSSHKRTKPRNVSFFKTKFEIDIWEMFFEYFLGMGGWKEKVWKFPIKFAVFWGNI